MADNKLITSTRSIEVSAVTIITAANKPFDLMGGNKKWNVINIYENIFNKCITGTIQIIDGTDIIGLLELHGNEFIFITFSRPGETEESKKYTKTFRIYKVDNRKPDDKSQGQTYVLHFCSEELIFSNQIYLSKAFKGRTASDYVYNICKYDLKVGEKRLNPLNFEQSYGIIDVALPATKPLDAIEFFSSQAFTPNESTFLFFENRDGYNFASLEGLFSKPPVTKIKYSTIKYTEDATSAPFVNYNDVARFNFKTFDMFENTKKATFAGSLYTLDLVRQKYTKNEYSLLNASDKIFIDASYPASFARNRNEKTVYDEYKTNIKFAMTNYNQTNTPYSLERGYRVNNTNIEKTLMQRESQLQLLNNTIMKMIVPANPLLSVGYLVEFDLPAFTSNDENSRSFDPYYSGKYLITAVRHTIIPSGEMQTSLELSKNSPATLYEYALSSEPYKKARSS